MLILLWMESRAFDDDNDVDEQTSKIRKRTREQNCRAIKVSQINSLLISYHVDVVHTFFFYLLSRPRIVFRLRRRSSVRSERHLFLELCRCIDESDSKQKRKMQKKIIVAATSSHFQNDSLMKMKSTINSKNATKFVLLRWHNVVTTQRDKNEIEMLHDDIVFIFIH